MQGNFPTLTTNKNIWQCNAHKNNHWRFIVPTYIRIQKKWCISNVFRTQESNEPVYKFSSVIADIFCPVIVWSGSTRSRSCMQKTSAVSRKYILWNENNIISREQCGLCPPISSRLLLLRTSDTTVTDHNITFSHALHSSSAQTNRMCTCTVSVFNKPCHGRFPYPPVLYI